MNKSLSMYVLEYTLWIICVDEVTFNVLTELKIPSIKLIKLGDVEMDRLLKVKSGRTAGEYCWTLTPFTPDFVFDRDIEVKEITYIDADVFVLNNKINWIYSEFVQSKKSVLITKHAYSPEYDQSALSGIFCVQFVIFKRDESRHIRKDWQDKCIEWCFNKPENGKFGDQKYLEEWPEKYSEDVHVLEKEYLILGPWNCTRFPYSDGAAWHFHGLRIKKDETTSELNVKNDGMYQIPATTLKNVYSPYIEQLNIAIMQLASVGFKI